MKLLKKEMLTRTTTKPGLGVFALISAVVISVGYVLFLAILAPEQLAEATAAASDLVCSGCVGNSDIANDAVGSAKIGSGQVGTSDIASSAVTSAKIGSGQVGNSDIATNAVTSSKISDGNGVTSVDIVNGQVSSADIADRTITSTDFAPGSLNILQRTVVGNEKSVPPFTTSAAHLDCPNGEGLTGGGFYINGTGMRIEASRPLDVDTWEVIAENNSNDNGAYMIAYAFCSGSGPA
jgi:hypothetical protein